MSETEAPSGVIVSALAELPPKTLIDEAALAAALKVTKRTVRNMVSRYELPPPQPFAGRAVWIVERILCWVNARAERLDRQAEKNANSAWEPR